MKKIIQLSILITNLFVINQVECSFKKTCSGVIVISAVGFSMYQHQKSKPTNTCSELFKAFDTTKKHYAQTKNGDCLGSIRLEVPLLGEQLYQCKKEYNRTNENKIDTVIFPDGGIFLFANKTE